jgi:adenylate cyclase
MWSENYDRDLSDIFALQDEITMKVITELQVKLTKGDQVRDWGEGKTNLSAFMHFLKALDYYYKQNMEDMLLARKEAEKAIRIDPNYPLAYIMLAGTYIWSLWWEKGTEKDNIINKAEKLLNDALEIDSENSQAYMGLSILNYHKGKFKDAVRCGRKSVVLNRNNAMAYYFLSFILYAIEQYEEALSVSDKYIQLDPIPTSDALVVRGEIFLAIKNYNKAKQVYQNAIESQPLDFWAHLGLVISYQLLGEYEKAKLQANIFYKLFPDFTVDSIYDPSDDSENIEDDWYFGSLIKAGLKLK